MTTLGNVWWSLPKLNIYIPYNPIIPLLERYSTEINAMSVKDWYKNVDRSFIYDSPKLEITLMSIHSSMSK